jgi:hypothetical protein
MQKRLLDPNGPRLFFGVLCKPFKGMAGTTRLELATSAVTGQRSNQLNYVPTCTMTCRKRLAGQGVYKFRLQRALLRWRLQ